MGGGGGCGGPACRACGLREHAASAGQKCPPWSSQVPPGGLRDAVGGVQGCVGMEWAARGDVLQEGPSPSECQL